MVKFCKKFEAQIIAEWSDGYMDYRLLKKGLKNIHAENNNQDSSSTMTEQTSCSKIFSSIAKLFQYGQKHRHHGPIQVHRKEDTYETELQEQFPYVEAAREFFALLDSQVNKVNLFYKAKEKEFLEWRDSLRKQMEILIVNSPSNRNNNNQGEIMFQGDKTNLQDAENMIKGSFIELYKGLRCLKSYRHLNMLGIVKILKKFDKATNKEVMPIYLKVVESSYFSISDKVARLTDEVKELLVQQFGEDDHRKAMTNLKPNQGKKSHGVTFFIGLFTGCFIALLIGYVIMAHIVAMYKHPSDTAYMETVYPVLSMFSLLFLHLFLYGCNIFVWKKARINYSFIFNLSPTKELKYREVFLICAASMTAVAGVLFFHLSLVAKGYTSAYVQTIPGILLLLFLLLLICPFNTVYKSSRYRFLSVIRNIAFSPLYKVDMLDFFMADQLCSQVPLLRNLEYITCYYMTGSYKTQDYNYCITNTLYRDLAYAVSFLPYYWRAMQCARRWHDEGETSHLVNLGKYGSAMLAAGAKVAYEKEESVGYLCLVVALSSVATVYQLYWDYVKDWGLLQLHSKNLWLRDELMIRRKSIYYFSMVLNLVLRLAWIQTVLHTTVGRVEYRVMGLLFAALEVIRRGQWNLYRLENEQVSNNGKFRAVKTVPLPFSEEDEED